jgi:hypothetical protein
MENPNFGNTCRFKISGKISRSLVGNCKIVGLFCSNCLCPGHVAQYCISKVRCKTCFNYGHKSCWCLTRTKPRLLWRPKVIVAPEQNPLLV